MAKPHTNYTTIFSTLLLIVTLLLLHISSSSAARLLVADTDDVYLSPKSTLTDTEPSMNLALPRRVLPCNTNRRAGTGFQALRLCSKPPHLLLSMLPKGGVPPSAPSRRTNDVNN